jgi:hypothetical protein
LLSIWAVREITEDRGLAQVVALHGIGQQYEGGRLIGEQWRAAMRDGLERAGFRNPDAVRLCCAFYGDLFRPAGKAGGLPTYGPGDVAEGFEQDLLLAWWLHAAEIERDRVPGLDTSTKLATPRQVQRALNALVGCQP